MPFISWLFSTYLFQTYPLFLYLFSDTCELYKIQLTVVQNAPDHKQRTLEPPALRCRTRASYVPLRAEGSESVPAVVCAFRAMSLWESCISQFPNIYFHQRTTINIEGKEGVWENLERIHFYFTVVSLIWKKLSVYNQL